jgi:NAD(P)H-quinone oxidoreductase subunit 5
MDRNTLEWLIVVIVGAPGVLFLGLSILWLLGWNGAERTASGLTGFLFLVLTLLSGVLTCGMMVNRTPGISVDVGNWFELGDYGFLIRLTVDRLSLPMVILTVVLVGLVGRFSSRYLHRDPGHFRFFALMNLFAFGSLLLFTAGSIELLIAGWELVGITSVLLIGFFHYREQPVANAIRVFASYRLADLCILVAVFLSHHWYGSGLWSGMLGGEWPRQTALVSGEGLNLLGILLVLAACGKSSQGPFFGWLPRAMEGPTPSSAIFYGAISVHAGAYLVLRIEPLLEAAPVARCFLMIVGMGTAVVATLIHRTCTDAKTGLAYASMTQLAVIFTEVSLGWTWVAMLHLIGHAAIRTAQFPRSPSMLRDHRQLHAASGGDLGETGGHYVAVVPHKLQLWLYAFGLAWGRYDACVDRFLLLPLVRAASFLSRMEPAWLSGLPDGRVGRPGQEASNRSLPTEQPGDVHV